jgi:hypothetical protein
MPGLPECVVVVSPVFRSCRTCLLARTIPTSQTDSQFTPPSILQSTASLTAILRTLAALSTALAPLLAQETTTHDCQARHQTSAVLLLLGWGLLWRRLLVAHGRLLVAILLRWGRAVAGLLLVLAWGRAVVGRVLVGCRGIDLDWTWSRQSWYGRFGGAYPYACCGC